MTVLNLRRIAGDTSAEALLARGIVRVDRATKWGNAFRIGRDGTRAEVVERYRRDLWRRIRAGEVDLEELAALDERDLACWCADLPCHGDVHARAAARASRRSTWPAP